MQLEEYVSNDLIGYTADEAVYSSNQIICNKYEILITPDRTQPITLALV